LRNFPVHDTRSVRRTSGLVLVAYAEVMARLSFLVGPQTGVEEVGRIGMVKSASVYRWREMAIAIAASI
jgi:hypothetical protein